MFSPCNAQIFHFKCTLKCCLLFLSIWTSLKFCCLVMNWLTHNLMTNSTLSKVIVSADNKIQSCTEQKIVDMVEKNHMNSRKCCFSAFFSFSHNVIKKTLTLSQTTKFRLFQADRVCS